MGKVIKKLKEKIKQYITLRKAYKTYKKKYRYGTYQAFQDWLDGKL